MDITIEYLVLVEAVCSIYYSSTYLKYTCITDYVFASLHVCAFVSVCLCVCVSLARSRLREFITSLASLALFLALKRRREESVTHRC